MVQSGNRSMGTGQLAICAYLIVFNRQAIHLHRIIYGTKQDTLADHVHIGKKTENKKTQPWKTQGKRTIIHF